MYDDLDSAFASLDRVPVPDAGVADAVRRGKRHRRRRVIAGTALAVAAASVVAVGVVALRPSTDTLPPASPKEIVESVHDIARGVLHDLRPRFCRGWDFYFKAEGAAGGEVRPVQCGMVNRIGIDDQGREAFFRLIKGPNLIIYAFSNEASKTAWVETHAAPWGGRLDGPGWVVDAMERGVFDELSERLPGAEVLSRPTQAWQPDLGHKVGPVDERFVPEVTLAQAARKAPQEPEILGSAQEPEILGAQLGRYSDASNDRVPAWIITYRWCVPAYGGNHASPGCEFDQQHVVIDATTGARIASFPN